MELYELASCTRTSICFIPTSGWYRARVGEVLRVGAGGGGWARQAGEEVALGNRGLCRVDHADEGLLSHQLPEALASELEEEDVIGLAFVRVQRVVLLIAVVADVDPGRDLLIGQADLWAIVLRIVIVPVDAQLGHRLPELGHTRARCGSPVNLGRDAGQLHRAHCDSMGLNVVWVAVEAIGVVG